MLKAKIQAMFVLTTSILAACGGHQDAGQQDSSSRRAGGNVHQSDAAATAALKIFPQPFANYEVNKSSEQITITSKFSSENPLTLPVNTVLRFSDTSVSFDTDGFPGQAYRIYKAAFNREPDAAGLGYWVGVMISGVDLKYIAESFISSSESQSLYGNNPTNYNLISAFYKNVLGRTPDAAGMAYWLDIADRNVVTRSQILIDFSESPENKAFLKDKVAKGIFFYEYDVTYVDSSPPLAKIVGPTTCPIGQAVVLNGQDSVGTHGKALTYRWELLRAPVKSIARLSSTSASTTSFTPDLPGEYFVTLTVIEGGTASTTAQTIITAGDINSSIGQEYVARNGITVTIDTFDAVDLGNGYVDYRITYTQNNHTSIAIDEGTLKLYYMDGSSQPQYGFFNKVYPNIPVTRSYNFTELKTIQPKILQYDHDHFFATTPTNGAAQWKYSTLLVK